MGKGGFGLVKGCKTLRTGKMLPDVVVDPGMFPEASWLYVSEAKYQEEIKIISVGRLLSQKGIYDFACIN